jgi:hypothetical protein
VHVCCDVYGCRDVAGRSHATVFVLGAPSDKRNRQSDHAPAVHPSGLRDLSAHATVLAVASAWRSHRTSSSAEHASTKRTGSGCGVCFAWRRSTLLRCQQQSLSFRKLLQCKRAPHALHTRLVRGRIQRRRRRVVSCFPFLLHRLSIVKHIMALDEAMKIVAVLNPIAGLIPVLGGAVQGALTALSMILEHAKVRSLTAYLAARSRADPGHRKWC